MHINFSDCWDESSGKPNLLRNMCVLAAWPRKCLFVGYMITKDSFLQHVHLPRKRIGKLGTWQFIKLHWKQQKGRKFKMMRQCDADLLCRGITHTFDHILNLELNCTPVYVSKGLWHGDYQERNPIFVCWNTTVLWIHCCFCPGGRRCLQS